MSKRNILLVLMLLFSSFGLTSCGNNNNSSTNSSSSSFIGTEKDYSILVKTNANIKLPNVAVEIYDGEDLVRSKMSDENGMVNFKLTEGNYDVKLENLPKGYYLDKDIDLEIGKYNYEFILTSKIIEEEAPKDTLYSLGDIIYDFEVKDSTGVNFKLSESLKTHDAVMINFWNTNCYWCAEEFPMMEEVYQEYKNNIEIIALSNMDTDADINGWKYEFELSFPMAFDKVGVWQMFGVNEFPVSIMIDRYGIISYGQTGAFSSSEELSELFDCFIGDDYVPYISIDEDEDGKRIPNVSMPSSSEIEAVINDESVNCIYTEDDDEDDLPYKWPWVISDDKKSIHPSNSKINNTGAGIETNITIPNGKTLAFDYLMSSELDYDVLYVFVDGVKIHELSGVETDWKTCYVYVSENTKVYNISLLYLKDEDGFAGEDTVYLNNVRIIDSTEIATPTYIYRYCSNNLIKETWNYEQYSTVVFNNEDGFYHVDDVNGPLVLADLIYPTNWSDELTPYVIASGGGIEEYRDVLYEYVSYAGNGTIKYTPVTLELYEALVAVTNMYGDPNNENEWLELCGYYSAYGTNGVQFEDPTKGLATYNAYTAVIGDQNFAKFDRPILPRGLKFKFVSETSGVYKINSIGKEETQCWIMDENGIIIKEADFLARKFSYPDASYINFEMYFYFEANKTYFITPAFYDYLYEGVLQFNLEYVGETYDLFTRCSPGYYTTGLDEYGNMTDEIISPSKCSYILKDDGYYYAVDSNGVVGSMIYADFVYSGFFNVSLNEMIVRDGFNFKEAGGKDLTLTARKYSALVEKDTSLETYGCTPVDEELKNLLQTTIDYHGFQGVAHQWLKVCYYYEHFGPVSI